MDVIDIVERRKSPRLNERIFILYQSIERQGMDMIKGFTENISAGGLMFDTDRPIPRGDVAILEIYQPSPESSGELISIITMAEVRWVAPIDSIEKYEGMDKFKIGMEFIKPDDNNRKTIAKYVRAKLYV